MNLQAVIDANSRLVVAIGLPLPGSRNDCRAFTESGVDRVCRGAPTIADGGYHEHALSRLKNWEILRDCRLKGNGVHQAMLGIARLHNLALTG